MSRERVRTLVESPYLINLLPYDRWADAQFDGTLEAINSNIEIMVSCAEAIIEIEFDEDPEEILASAEWSAYRTVVSLQQFAAVSPCRRNPLLLDVGTLLCDAVGQYLPLLPGSVHQAILKGVELAERRADITVAMLSSTEVKWQQWLLPRLCAHLVLSFEGEDVMCDRQLRYPDCTEAMPPAQAVAYALA